MNVLEYPHSPLLGNCSLQEAVRSANTLYLHDKFFQDSEGEVCQGKDLRSSKYWRRAPDLSWEGNICTR